MDVIIDADIASTFGRLEKLYLLQKLFPKSKLYICSAVQNDLLRGRERGYDFIDVIFEHLNVMKPTESEVKETENLLSERSIGKGEAESIIIAKSRNMLFLTNDKIATNAAKYMDVTSMNLPMIVRQFWKNNILTKDKCHKLISEIEEKDNIIFVNKDNIFEK